MKYARPNSYCGKQANTHWTGDLRAANAVEAAAGLSDQLAITPATLAIAIGALVLNPTFTTVTTTSNATIGGNLTINGAGKMLQIHHGAVTDFCGTATLASGTVTVANTNIATGDIIILSRVSANGTTTFGILTYTISNGASFTITSLILGTPGSTQTADTSIISYVIVRPV